MKLKPKQSVDVSTQISSSLHCRLESNSDDEDLADSADHAGGKNDEDMGDALPSVPFKYLELFTELRDLFSAPEGLLIRSCFETLHEAMMIAAEERGERPKTVCCFRLFPACALLGGTYTFVNARRQDACDWDTRNWEDLLDHLPAMETGKCWQNSSSRPQPNFLPVLQASI